MAEVTGLRNNALPYPVYGAPWGITFALLDADGDPTSPSSPDSEISKNADTFADCTNEAVEIATTSGSCYLLLTGTELTTDVATVQIKSTGAKTTVITLFPRKLPTIRSGTAAGGTGSTIVLDSGANANDDYYNGMICIATIDSNIEVRVISDYTGSSKTATVVPDWNVTPDSDDTFIVKLPESVMPGALLDELIMGTNTLRMLLRGFAAALVGKADGLGTSTVHYRNIADSMNVITATVDADGNRSAVTLDLDDTP